MTAAVDPYERGFQQARADQAKGWWHNWLRARELADDALYAPKGLTPEQHGYAAGLRTLDPGFGTELPAHVADQMRLYDPLLPPPPRPVVACPAVPKALGPSLARRLPYRLAKRLYFQRQKNGQWGKEEVHGYFQRGLA